MIRNIAIIAHVDHGKTTLVDSILRIGGNKFQGQCVMDSNQLQREKGITILSKATGMTYNNYKINIVDTPGHHDFGGEVQRIMNMVDGVCLLVCATQGPMPQTKFVLKKALQNKLKPIVVINKVDRPSARIKQVQTQIFQLFCDLNVSQDVANYPTYYASGKNGWAVQDMNHQKKDIKVILDGIIKHVPPPIIQKQPAFFTMLVSQTQPNNYHGKMLIGRINSGKIKIGDKIQSFSQDNSFSNSGKISKIIKKVGIGQIQIQQSQAGDIISLAGINSNITDIICHQGHKFHIPATKIDPPLMGISVSVNTGPLAGKDGHKLAFNDLKKRFQWQSQNDVALKVQVKSNNTLQVKGRGDLHLGVVIQKIRRQGFQMVITPPQIIYKLINGQKYQPSQKVVFEIPNQIAHTMIDRMNNRKATFLQTQQNQNFTKMIFIVPSRGLIGLRSQLLSQTKGLATLKSTFHDFIPDVGIINKNTKGAIISMVDGICNAYGLRDVEKHGLLFIKPGDKVYPGMVIGECIKQSDLQCNPTKQRKVTNVRTHSHQQKIILKQSKTFNLQDAISYVRDNQLIEVTPRQIRIRKKLLDKGARDRQRRQNRNV